MKSRTPYTNTSIESQQFQSTYNPTLSIVLVHGVGSEHLLLLKCIRKKAKTYAPRTENYKCDFDKKNQLLANIYVKDNKDVSPDFKHRHIHDHVIEC